MRPRLILLLVIGLGLVALFALTNRRRALPLAIHTIRADDSTLQTARELGASHIVQVFTWREIQPSPAEFHWEYSDWLVRAAEYYDLRVIARLDKAPRWAVAGEMTADAPPAQLEDFANFAGRVAARYRGRIAAYIIWNEPNLAIEWGNRAPNPGEYAELLRVTSARLRTADPRALVLAAGLAPTNENHAGAMDDRDFLRALYAAGARDAFDALAAHPYPFTYAPDDPRGAHAALNFQRLWDWRAIMIAAGDATKPIWITEFGYTTAPPPEFAHLRVSEAEQARGLVRAFEIAREQMPFVELFTVWNLARELPPSNEQAGYSLLRADGAPKPAAEALRAMEKEPLAARLAQAFTPAPPARDAFPILARDALAHLGDSEYPLPWVPLYRTKNPSVEWIGEFYLREADLRAAPRGKAWQLTLETMQTNDLNNRVLINDQPATPPYLPTEDFTSVWVSAQFEAPAHYLRIGRNTVTLRVGKLFPAFQQLGFTWDDLQVRNVWLRQSPP